MWDEINDLDLCLAMLFLEVSIFIGFFFTTNRNNKAIAVGNFVYYLKNETSDGNKRQICNITGCSASVTTDINNKIIKLNNKPISTIESLDKLHPKHEPYSEIELNKIKNWENLKNKAVNQSGSVMSMFEQEEIRLAKEGIAIDEIATTMPQYEEKRSE